MTVLKHAFKVYDSDNSGFLESEEIRFLFIDAYLQLGYNEPDHEELDEIILLADDNGDGKFSFDELFKIFAPKIQGSIGLRFLMPNKKEMEDLLKEIFDKYDNDRSGFLEREEILK